MVLLNVDSAMLNLVSMQWNNPDISDIKLKLGTSTVHSHKFILASHSSVFKAMLYGKNFLENKKDVLEITNFNSAILTEVLKSLYTQTIELNSSTVLEVIAIADHYNLQTIKKVASEYTATLLNDIEVCSTLSFAKMYGASELSNSCETYIANNAFSIFHREEYYSLKEDIMIEILARKDLNLSELELYNAIVRWGQHNSPNSDLKTKLAPLLPYICFAAISPTALVDQVQKDEIVPLPTLLEAHIFYSTGRNPSSGYWARGQKAKWKSHPKLQIKDDVVTTTSTERVFTTVDKPLFNGSKTRIMTKDSRGCSQLLIGIVNESVNLQSNPLQNQTYFYGSDSKIYKNGNVVGASTFSISSGEMYEFELKGRTLHTTCPAQKKNAQIDLEEGLWYIAVGFGCCSQASFELK